VGSEEPTRWSYDEFLRLARRFQGQTLETKTGKQFTVEVKDGLAHFTPESTGTRRNTSRAVTEDLLERFTRTRSFRPSDYVDITRNASYYVALLRLA
jgi:hypothetical protein